MFVPKHNFTALFCLALVSISCASQQKKQRKVGWKWQTFLFKNINFSFKEQQMKIESNNWQSKLLDNSLNS